MLAMVERDLGHPRAIRLPFHRMRARVPIIEVAGEMDCAGIGGEKDEPGAFAIFPC